MKKQKNAQTLQRTLSFMRPYRKYLALALALAALTVAATLYIPILTGRAIDHIIGKGQVDFGAITPILAGIAGAAVIGGLAQWLMSLFTNKVAYQTVRDIRERAIEKLERVPIAYIDSHRHGDIISRVIVDADQVSDGLLMGFTQLFTGIITILGTIAFMFYANAKIAAIVVVITPLSLLVANFIARRTYRMFREQSETRGALTGFVEEMVGNQRVVKAFGHEAAAQVQFDEVNEQLRKCGMRATFFSSITNPSTRFVNGVVYAAVGVFGAIAVLNDPLFTVGSLSCFLTYANQYTKPFNEISSVMTELQNALASAQRVFDLIDEKDEPRDDDDAVVLHGDAGAVSLENVAFSYVPDRKLIENLSLNVKSGQRIAIVGPTGCGKTTIINLLMRFYDVDSGRICVNGTDIRHATRDSLRGMYGMVLQDTWLKAGTIRENIAYAKPDASEEAIVRAAREAHADGFIRRLQSGYDTIITEDGGNISQGQKQLLCIARVMLTLPPMLILDEATSSIDTRTEMQIQSAFSRMMQGRTSFVVAHRLSTIREADCILVMNAGHIVEQGTHAELLQKNGFYANLYNSQFALTAGRMVDKPSI